MFVAKSRAVFWPTLVAVALALSGCTDSGDDDTSGSDVLTLWHYEHATSAMGIAWAEAIKQFETSHPGVTVKFEQKEFEQIRQNAGITLNADGAPDLLEYNKGNATAGTLSKQGLLTDLTPQVTRRGWDELLAPSLQTTARYDDQGIMGSGAWYGIPNYAEYVMVYYNKDMFAERGLQIPTTLDEFQTVMDVFVEAGVTPLSVSGAEYPAQQIFYELVLSQANRSFVDAYERYQGKVDFAGPEMTFGANTFADWVRKGYINEDAASVKAEDMSAGFQESRFPMVIVGSWLYGEFTSGIKDFQWGTFLFPGNKLHPGSSGNLWVVPEKAKNKDLAYDFIDITMKPEIQNLLGNSGGIPVAADPSKITDEKNRELIANFTAIESTDGLAFYPDWPAPGFYDVLGVAIQDLINGSKTPAQVLTDVAGPYHDNLTSLGINP
ncbi:MAG: extracellular solute-binding protein [Dactylosporangium sp.]|nr:extracellular solute-binding protein [Dactylosporangium sp.]NNJ59429.1 extracellular solute-binding protein [Dactylosporangium sp.]